VKKDTYESAFEAISDQTMDSIGAILEKNQFHTVGVIAQYIDAYYDFFQTGFDLIKCLKPLVELHQIFAAEVCHSFNFSQYKI
jgi:hypothetical protein